MRIGLISCTKLKLDHAAPAAQMYSASDLFRKALAYCQKHYDQTMILSAKHGLLHLSDPIEPYDETLRDKSPRQRKDWAIDVYLHIFNRIPAGSQIFFHAGRKYRENLIPLLEAAGFQCFTPLEGKGIGLQKAFYKKQEEKV
jgi:hypothetical protein